MKCSCTTVSAQESCVNTSSLLLQSSLSKMIELYLDLISPPCRAVFLFAKAVKIPFEFKLVQLGAGKPKSK